MSFSRMIATVALALALGLTAAPARAHNVGQIETTVQYAPETLAMLIARGGGGIRVGDELSYIIHFLPVENGATVGANGYVTAYVPPGSVVIGAEYVEPDGAGGYVLAGPNVSAPTWTGFGPNDNSFPGWTTTDAETLAACSAAGVALEDCNGVMMEHYADTGVFFSTDGRTALFIGPDTDGLLRPTNGYHVDPSAEGQLLGILGIPNARTHNLWDASQTNAFGGRVPGDTPRSDAPSFAQRGAIPFNAGSAVAGPGAGYQLDNTGAVGPWRRVFHPGSMIGSRAAGVPTVRGVVGASGAPTLTGRVVTPAAPLPAATNAVRWAVGRLTVGEIHYVRLSLRVTDPVPATGFHVNSEVFGADSANAAGKDNKDNVWRYHVPSGARLTDVGLYVQIEIVEVNGMPYLGGPVPTDATLRLRLTYANVGSAPLRDVVLSIDTPPETAACPTPTASFEVIRGPDILPHAPTCESGLGRGDVLSFATIPSLGSGVSGVVELDLVTASDPDDLLRILAQGESPDLPEGVLVETLTLVATVDQGLVNAVATVTPSTAGTGDVVTYTITITNEGNQDVDDAVVSFLLPSGGAGPTDIFEYEAASSSVAGSGFPDVAPATSRPPTLSPYMGDNRQQLTWSFPGTSLAPGASVTITFRARVGDTVPDSPPAYFSVLDVQYDNGLAADARFTNTATAPVTVGNPDFDDDGVRDRDDLDDDDDGILDVDELPAAFTADPDADHDRDGVPNWADNDYLASVGLTAADVDPDGDGLPSHHDLDADGDGVTDAWEADGSDDDLDGIRDGCAPVDAMGVCASGSVPAPTASDADGVPDFLDPDADDDGLSDAIEAHDTDGDGVADTTAAGADTDGDGLDDAFDPDCAAAADCAGVIGTVAALPDANGDGTPNFQQACGDAYLAATEACDDGDTDDDDECSNACLLGLGEPCTDSDLCDSTICHSGTDTCEICDDDTTGGIDTGCSMMVPACVTPMMGGAMCAECDDDQVGGATDDGCDDDLPLCDPTSFTCGVCADSATGAVDDGCAAPTPVCDTAGAGGDGVCVTCEDDEPGMTLADADFGCGAAMPFCDESGATPVCIGCTDDASCDDDNECTTDACVGGGCESTPVMAGVECTGGVCNGSATDPRCVECVGDDDCPTGSCIGGVCAECVDDMTGAAVDTGCTAAAPLCDETAATPTCVPCVDDTAGGLDTGCRATAPACDDSGAVPTCLRCEDTAAGGGLDNGCLVATPICRTAAGRRSCVECLIDDHCAGDLVCSPSFTCVMGCDSDADCAPTPETPLCDVAARVCVECLDDDDCPGVTICGATRTCDFPDSDDDGIPDDIDIDDDNDGIPDVAELDGTDLSVDGDGDGVPDYADPDVVTCDDADGDGVCDELPREVDEDQDGVPNHLDLDADGDGIADLLEGGGVDADRDGRVDDFIDVDADGLDDRVAAAPLPLPNTDGEGKPDFLDTDADGDGLTDTLEADGVDADGDGRPDGPFVDADGDGLADDLTGLMALPIPDTDGDGAPDYQDVDADDDGIVDAIEGHDDDGDGEGPEPSGEDTDGDGIDDAFDPDCVGGACDGVVGVIATVPDADDDGVPDFRDVDDDGDGITTAVECPVPATCADSDMDGTPDYLELDADDDGLPDATEGHDADFDGLPDREPSGADTDGDGLDDAFDPDCRRAADCDGVIGVPAPVPDLDEDGTPNYQDVDDDGDGMSTATEIRDAAEYEGPAEDPTDVDGDGLPNWHDLDSDGDGASDMTESVGDRDIDDNGILDYLDPMTTAGDRDRDGVPDAVECPDPTDCPDFDGDGVPDVDDPDDDDDGVLTVIEWALDDPEDGDPDSDHDFDDDGQPNHLDLDADDDGIPDLWENGGRALDADGDGLSDDATDADMDGLRGVFDDDDDDASVLRAGAPRDTDGDGKPDIADLDADGDGLLDVREADGVDADGDGQVDDPTDADMDGLSAVVDPDEGGTPWAVPDTDGDGAFDFQDVDSDGDTVPDRVEAHDVDADAVADVVASGADADRDGIDDAFDPDTDGTAAAEPDHDGDGAPDWRDVDDDGDTVLTRFEAPDPDGDGDPRDARDTDGDGTPDYLDVDDDGDELLTRDESPDPNGDGDPADALDSDGDGVPDYLDPAGGPTAGAFSGGACGCGATGPAGSSWALLLIVGVALVRRRRSRRG